MSERPEGQPLDPGPQPTTAAAPSPAGPRFLGEEQRALLAAVLDRLVPATPEGDLPGAGALGVAAAVERSMGATAALRRTLLDLLFRVEAAAGGRLDALAGEAQDAALRAVEAADPLRFAALVSHAYRGYYTHPRVMVALERITGFPARPPQPLGHELPPWDPALLDRQRRREPFWRRTS